MRVEKGGDLLLEEVALEGAEELFADSTQFSGAAALARIDSRLR